MPLATECILLASNRIIFGHIETSGILLRKGRIRRPLGASKAAPQEEPAGGEGTAFSASDARYTL